jgi:hypothetical protein
MACNARASDVPIPAPRPGQGGEVPAPAPKPAYQAPSPTDTLTTRPSLMSAACEAELKSLGVGYAKTNPVKDEAAGCAIDQPVELQSLPGSVELKPGAVLDCPTAVRLARFAAGDMQSNAKAIMGSGVKSVQHTSAYVCKVRNGSSKLSEHAFGRAIDIGSVTLANGVMIPVTAMPKDREMEATFLTALRRSACGPFATVLGPGTDADHAEHFHFDLAPRSGGAYCR